MKTNNSSANSAYMSIVLILLILVACRDRVTPPDDKPYVSPITLTFEDASCTEAWIRIKTTRDIDGGTLILKRDGITQSQISNLKSQIDTLIVDEGLLPKRTYTYKAYLHHSNTPSLQIPVDSSAPLIHTTIDTTSHNFTWKIDTLGDGSSSVLYDVAIINDTLAYAVGEIYKKDSLGNWDPNAYNVVHWNGQEWKLKRFYTYSSCSYVDYAPLKSIWAFSDTSIVVTTGGGIWWFNGKTFKPDCSIRPLLTGAINKLWGTSSSDLYAVGNNGNIAHYNGTSWRRLELPPSSGQGGTELDIYDIYGDKNQETGETEIYAVAAEQHVSPNKNILKVEPAGVKTVSNNAILSYLKGVWFKAGVQYYVVGSGMYHKRNPIDSSSWNQIPFSVTQYGTYKINGNNINDIFVCGAFGEMLHFNGVSWKSYRNVTGITLGAYYGLSFKNNLIIAVGQESPRGVIAIGRR